MIVPDSDPGVYAQVAGNTGGAAVSFTISIDDGAARDRGPAA